MALFDFLGKGLKNTLGIDLGAVPFVGNMFGGNDAQEAHQKQFQNIIAQMQAQKPLNEQSRMNAMNQGALAFEPMQKLIAQMYGPQAVVDIKAMQQNPLAKPPHQQQPASVASGLGRPKLPNGYK